MFFNPSNLRFLGRIRARRYFITLLVGLILSAWCPHVCAESLPQRASSLSFLIHQQSVGICQNPNETFAQAENLRRTWLRVSLEQAISLYSTAQRCWQIEGNTLREAEASKGIADLSLLLGDFPKARENYLRLIELRKKGVDRGAEAEAYADLSSALTFVDEPDKAREAAETALSISRSIPDLVREARSHYALGMALYFGGHLRTALDHENQALTLIRGTSHRELLARILLGLGYIHNDLDDLEQALSCYNQSLTEWRAIGNRWGESKTLTSLGLVLTLLGDRDGALRALRETLPVSRQMGDRISEAAGLNNIAYVYQTLGEFNLALDHYQKALKVFEDIKLLLGQALNMQYCADIYLLMGDREKALIHYEKAISLARTIKNPLMEADILNSRGSLYFVKGDRQQGLDSFEKALAAYRQANHWRGQSAALNNIGYYFEQTGNKQKAKDSYSEALAFARSAQDREGAASILFNLARIESALGMLDQAQAHIEESLLINETSRAKVASQELRVSYFASIHQHYEFYIDLLMQLHRVRPTEGFDVIAFQVSERARARSLLDLLTQAGTRLAKTVTQELLEKEKTLRAKLNAAYLQGESSNPKSTKTGREELSRLRLDYEDIKHQIRMSSAGYASIALPQTLRLSEIQRDVIDSETAILEYSLGDSRSFLWLITTGGIYAFELPARSVIETEVSTLSRLLLSVEMKRNARQSAISDQEFWEQSSKVANLILRPALKQTTAKRLVVVGDGVLQNLPYAALSVSDTTVGHRSLINDYEVVTLPSVSVLTVLRRQLEGRKPAPLSVAVLADPVFDSQDIRVQVALRGNKTSDATISKNDLSMNESKSLGRALRGSHLESRVPRLLFSRREAQSIRRFSQSKGVFEALDFEASRTTALSPELSKYRTIHFATHGILNSEHPELSGILLSMVNANGKPEEGFLQLNDIYNLRLPADLVVLSACQTALGRDFKGEGLIGLTRGFMHAGAARVVASLWKVDDAATAELMALFYKEMFVNGQRPASALRAAQLELSKQKRYQSPYFWAGFTLQGEWK